MRLKSLARGALLVALLPCPAALPQPDPNSAEGIPVFGAPDKSAPPIAVLAPGDAVTPVAESQSSGGVKWYLVKIPNGLVGWIKRSDSTHAKRLDDFFKSLPPEPSASPQLPLVSSTSAPRGSIIVAVSWLGRSAIVPVVLNQTQRGNLMLDTGATNTVISQRLATLLALRPTQRGLIQTVGGVVPVSVAQLGSLRVGDAEATDLPVIIHDFSRDPRVEGLLGMDFLGRYHIGLDAQRRVLVLSHR